MLKCFTQSASLPHFLGMDQNSVNYKIRSYVTAGTSVYGICFSSSVCHLLWHGAQQFTVSLNGLSVVFIWTFSPGFFWLFVCFVSLVSWGFFACVFEESITNFLISSYSGNAEMGDCKIRALRQVQFLYNLEHGSLSTYQVLRPTT